jgi:mRNA-degrading endonuclease RelE of RelBE toxin-antitoxin system
LIDTRVELRRVQLRVPEHFLNHAHIGAVLESRRIGNVKKLKPPRTGFRLRCGDHRVFFDYTDPDVIAITAVLDSKEAYR